MATETVKVVCLGCGRDLHSQPYQASQVTLRIDTLPCQHCLEEAREEGRREATPHTIKCGGGTG